MIFSGMFPNEYVPITLTFSLFSSLFIIHLPRPNVLSLKLFEEYWISEQFSQQRQVALDKPISDLNEFVLTLTKTMNIYAVKAEGIIDYL